MVTVGLTLTEVPLPTDVPPQFPLYHCQFAPVPNEPPTTESVVFPPLQITFVPLIEVGATDNKLTVTVSDTHVVVLQVPTART